MNCYIHTEKEPIGICVSCGKFICSECNTEINNKNYCKKCIAELFEENNQQGKKQNYDSELNNTVQPNIIIKNTNKNIIVGRVRRKRSVLFDLFMICITGGLWIIWMIFRPKYY